MWQNLKRWIKNLSLAQQFLYMNLVILMVGMTLIGWWIGKQIKVGVIDYTSATTALYVDSFVAPIVQELSHQDRLSSSQIEHLDTLLHETPLGQEIVAFKIWGEGGQIMYANDAVNIGRTYTIKPELSRAWRGEVVSEVSDLEGEENTFERDLATALLETYSPVRLNGTNRVIAVAEFYQPIDNLQADILAAQLRSWLLVGVAALLMYLGLASIVKPASDVIIQQQAQLQQKLAQNEALNKRIQRAATRTTALNEQYLRRISAELHDGPAQDLGLALLRIEPLADAYQRYHANVKPNTAQAEEKAATEADFQRIQVALSSALTDLRAICAGLRMPNIENLTPSETIEQAVRDFKRKTDSTVKLDVTCIQTEVPLPIRITLYRVLQEALANSYQHAQGQQQQVRAGQRNNEVWIEISDNGPGFDPLPQNTSRGHFGLAGMRERVEILGGRFEIESQPGQGSVIRAILPLSLPTAKMG